MNTAVKSPLEAALMSPDPAIRRVAQRRKEIDAEAVKLDSFLHLYSDLPASGEEGPLPFRPVASVLAAPKPRIQGDFVAMTRATLREAGRPLGLDELYRAFWARVPEQHATKKDSFRQRLFQEREHIALLSDEGGYWMAGEPIPGAQAENVAT